MQVWEDPEHRVVLADQKISAHAIVPSKLNAATKACYSPCQLRSIFEKGAKFIATELEIQINDCFIPLQIIVRVHGVTKLQRLVDASAIVKQRTRATELSTVDDILKRFLHHRESLRASDMMGSVSADSQQAEGDIASQAASENDDEEHLSQMQFQTQCESSSQRMVHQDFAVQVSSVQAPAVRGSLLGLIPQTAKGLNNLSNNFTPSVKLNVTLKQSSSGDVDAMKSSSVYTQHVPAPDASGNTRGPDFRVSEKLTLTIANEEVKQPSEAIGNPHQSPKESIASTSIRMLDPGNGTDDREPFHEYRKYLVAGRYLRRGLKIIHKCQQEILDNDQAWSPSLAGMPIRPGTVPITLLDRLIKEQTVQPIALGSTPAEGLRLEKENDVDSYFSQTKARAISDESSLKLQVEAQPIQCQESDLVSQGGSYTGSGNEDIISWSSTPVVSLQPGKCGHVLPPDSPPLGVLSSSRLEGQAVKALKGPQFGFNPQAEANTWHNKETWAACEPGSLHKTGAVSSCHNCIIQEDEVAGQDPDEPSASLRILDRSNAEDIAQERTCNSPTSSPVPSVDEPPTPSQQLLSHLQSFAAVVDDPFNPISEVAESESNLHPTSSGQSLAASRILVKQTPYNHNQARSSVRANNGPIQRVEAANFMIFTQTDSPSPTRSAIGVQSTYLVSNLVRTDPHTHHMQDPNEVPIMQPVVSPKSVRRTSPGLHHTPEQSLVAVPSRSTESAAVPTLLRSASTASSSRKRKATETDLGSEIAKKMRHPAIAARQARREFMQSYQKAERCRDKPVDRLRSESESVASALASSKATNEIPPASSRTSRTGKLEVSNNSLAAQSDPSMNTTHREKEQALLLTAFQTFRTTYQDYDGTLNDFARAVRLLKACPHKSLQDDFIFHHHGYTIIHAQGTRADDYLATYLEYFDSIELSHTNGITRSWNRNDLARAAESLIRNDKVSEACKLEEGENPDSAARSIVKSPTRPTQEDSQSSSVEAWLARIEGRASPELGNDSTDHMPEQPRDRRPIHRSVQNSDAQHQGYDKTPSDATESPAERYRKSRKSLRKSDASLLAASKGEGRNPVSDVAQFHDIFSWD